MKITIIIEEEKEDDQEIKTRRVPHPSVYYNDPFAPNTNNNFPPPKNGEIYC